MEKLDHLECFHSMNSLGIREDVLMQGGKEALPGEISISPFQFSTKENGAHVLLQGLVFSLRKWLKKI